VNTALLEEDRAALLAIAREAILAHLEGRRPEPTACAIAAREPLGAFVTLHKRSALGRRLLRGCIGRMRADKPLASTVIDMAIAAAFEDPRFPPVIDSEMSSIDIEISVLSPFQRCRPEDVRPGIDGVYLTRARRSGVFLPQVATEQGWDRLELLEQLCVKAGLEGGSYAQADAELYRFTATVFGELGSPS
jgi:AmmeMemoRadiSam system protein A